MTNVGYTFMSPERDLYIVLAIFQNSKHICFINGNVTCIRFSLILINVCTFI